MKRDSGREKEVGAVGGIQSDGGPTVMLAVNRGPLVMGKSK